MSSNSLTITWYGRCCFLVETDGRSILFDPYDRYLWDIEVGQISADIEIISSTWHDHGHIGASPQAMIYSYPGTYQDGNIRINGIEAREDRGTPTVIFNVQVGPYSITNFADFGPVQEKNFNSNLSNTERKILETTNIAFIRPSIVRDREEDHVHNENALHYCNPAIIIPEHYFPESFILEWIPQEKQSDFLIANSLVDEMLSNFKYPIKHQDDFSVEIEEEDLHNKQSIKLLKLHPQVKFN